MKKITVYVDTREKNPYKFKGMRETKKALKTGDYSVQGGLGPNGIVIERKTAEDLVNTLCNAANRKRFKKELVRMGKFGYRAIVVEATPRSFASTVAFSKSSADPFKVLQLFMELCLEHKVTPLFCEDRKTGEYMTAMILRSFIDKSIQQKWLV